MGKIVFVEVLDKKGYIRERIKVDSFPITVGRGYANAVIVDDRLVSAEHLRISLDMENAIIVEDLNSLNGTRLSKSWERIERYTVPAGGEAVICIGQTVLRLRSDDFMVGPVASSRAFYGPFGRYIENKVIAFLLFVAGFGINVFTYAQEIDKKVIWSDLTGMSLALLIMFVVWTGFWSFINRLVAHSFRFMTHLAISGIASIVFLILFTAAEYGDFIFSSPAAAQIVRFAGFGVIFSLLLYAHLSIVSELSARKRILSSALVSAGIVGISLLIIYANKKEFSNELGFSSAIKPFGRQWVRTVSSEEYFKNLGQLKTKIDAMAQEAPKGKMVKE
jgi:FHA domain